jgi:hypothetical protein
MPRGWPKMFVALIALAVVALLLAAERAECVFCPEGPCWPEYGCPDVFGRCVCLVAPGETEGRCFGAGGDD